MKPGEELFQEVQQSTTLFLSLLCLLLSAFRNDNCKNIYGFLAKQPYLRDCLVPSPRTTRNRTLAKTATSAYAVMTESPCFPLRKRHGQEHPMNLRIQR